MKESVLAVIQVASSVAMSCGPCGLDNALVPQALRDTPRKASGHQVSPMHGGEIRNDQPVLPDFSNCQVSVRSLREMFDNSREEEDMEICTRL